MRGGREHMKFCQSMLHETVELLKGNQLPYSDSILIGENASGKSEAIKRFMQEADRVIYFIDAINRNFNIHAVKALGEQLQYKSSILRKRLEDDHFNLRDSWAYYGTATECVELIYPHFEERIQSLLRSCFGIGFSIYSPETQEVQYDSGDIGRISNGYQAIIRILLELLYFQEVNPVKNQERALVIIDEIDEYLSPNNAGKLFELMKKEFPKTDFIVTTHSPEVIAVASKCNIIIMHESSVEILDAGDFRNIDEAMVVFKGVFGRSQNSDGSQYEEILRQLFNNRIAGIWGENEQRSYAMINETELTKAEKVLYRQIGAW